jgi:hypothetical protein
MSDNKTCPDCGRSFDYSDWCTPCVVDLYRRVHPDKKSGDERIDALICKYQQMSKNEGFVRSSIGRSLVRSSLVCPANANVPTVLITVGLFSNGFPTKTYTTSTTSPQVKKKRARDSNTIRLLFHAQMCMLSLGGYGSVSSARQE